MSEFDKIEQLFAALQSKVEASDDRGDDIFDVDKFSNKLETSYVGRRMVYTKVTGTTMDDAREDGLRGCPDGTIHLAETQTKARGYKNHSWNALYTGNLYFSIVLYRPKALSEAMNYRAIFDTELMAGLSLLEIATHLKLDDFCLKWPNDVWVKGRKVAGILLENAGPVTGPNGEEKQLYILGMGINVNSDMRRHPELYGIATSVRCENRGRFIDREQMMATFCSCLEKLLGCDHEMLYEKATKSQLFDRGLRIRATEFNSGKTFTGVMKEISSDWMVTVQDDNGEVWTKSQYDLSLRPIPSKKILVYNGEMADLDSANNLIAMFQSLVDLVTFSVETIGDAKLLEDNWKESTAIVAIGELTGRPNQALAEIADYTYHGGSVLVVRSGATAVFSELKEVPDLSTSFMAQEVRLNYQPDNVTTVITRKSTIDMTAVKLQMDHAIATFQSRDQPNVIAASVSIVGEGKCAFFGFNVEMTYMDMKASADFTEDVLRELSSAVFKRDSLVQFAVSKLVDA